MSSFENIGVKIITRQENDNVRGISFPPIKKNQDLGEHIKDAVFRSMNFTSKMINYDELSGKYVDEYEDDNNLRLITLQGATQVLQHHCSGRIQCDITNTENIRFANMYFEVQETCIQNNSLQGKNIKIERSNGNIIDGIISSDSIIKYSERFNSFMVHSEFKIGNDVFYKFIPFKNYERNGKIYKGLLELNPQLLDEDLIVTILESPDWMIEERNEWYESIKSHFKEYNFNVIYVN